MSKESPGKRQVPIAEGFFTWPSDEPRLIGGRCKSCNTYFFPRNHERHRVGCQHKGVEEILFSRRGKLRSYSWQYYPPPPPFRGPSPLVPFGIGLVEFPEGIRIVGIMTGGEPKDLKTGMEVEVVAEKLYTDENGDDYLTWKFRPV